MSENIYAVQNGTNFENMKTFGVPPVLFLTKGGVRDLYFASSQPSCMTAIPSTYTVASIGLYRATKSLGHAVVPGIGAESGRRARKLRVDRLSFCTGLAFCDLQPRSRRCYPMYVAAAAKQCPSIATTQ